MVPKVRNKSAVFGRVPIAEYMQQEVLAHSEHDRSAFLMVDERSGKLWNVPPNALVIQLRGPLEVSHQAWNTKFLNTNKDAFAFLTAEVALELAGRSELPTHVFESSKEGCVIYTIAISVQNSRWSGFGSTFHWPVSFEKHFELGEQSQSFGAPVPPIFDIQHDYHPQRPHPSFISGSTMVLDVATELNASQRDFYLNACCAPYLFRDCSYSLEQYWKSTKRHKEHHPHRLALKHRMRREEERRKLENLQTLLERSNDPNVEKLVVRNAKRGIKVLSELMQNAPDVQYVSKRRKLNFTSFFGNEGLPLELQSVIVKMCVQHALSNSDSAEAWKMFKSFRNVSVGLREIASEIGTSLVRDASADLCAFICKGMPLRQSRMDSFHYWTYRELGCSPTCLVDMASALSLSPKGQKPAWQLYFKARLASGLAANVCRQRATVELKKRHLPPNRVQWLRRIVKFAM
jgi:hypothetical protein